MNENESEQERTFRIVLFNSRLFSGDEFIQSIVNFP